MGEKQVKPFSNAKEKIKRLLMSANKNEYLSIYDFCNKTKVCSRQYFNRVLNEHGDIYELWNKYIALHDKFPIHIKSKYRVLNKWYLYFLVTIPDESYVKIGISSDFTKRFNSLNTGCPFYLKSIFICDGSPELEKKIFDDLRFHRVRMNGEWFHNNEIVKNYIFDFISRNKSIGKNFYYNNSPWQDH